MGVDELMKQLSEGGINVQGDFVMNKTVENEIGNVEAGGIGIQIVNGAVQPDADKKEKEPTSSNSQVPVDTDGELCHFIYPGLDEDEGWKIHKQIKDLVMRFPLKEICSFLKKLEDEQKILLPPDPQFAFSELHRIGLPPEDTPGYTYGNFAKCYRNR